MSRTRFLSPLDEAEWFRTLPPLEQRAVRRSTTIVRVAAGRRLIKEGTFDRCCFLILEGTAQVRRGDRDLATLGPGRFVGELGTLADAPRLADVFATTELTVIVATASELSSLLAECPTVSRRLMRHLANLAAAGLSEGADAMEGPRSMPAQ